MHTKERMTNLSSARDAKKASLLLLDSRNMAKTQKSKLAKWSSKANSQAPKVTTPKMAFQLKAWRSWTVGKPRSRYNAGNLCGVCCFPETLRFLHRVSQDIILRLCSESRSKVLTLLWRTHSSSRPGRWHHLQLPSKGTKSQSSH